jgi:hypothetical protein
LGPAPWWTARRRHGDLFRGMVVRAATRLGPCGLPRLGLLDPARGTIVVPMATGVCALRNRPPRHPLRRQTRSPQEGLPLPRGGGLLSHRNRREPRPCRRLASSDILEGGWSSTHATWATSSTPATDGRRLKMRAKKTFLFTSSLEYACKWA